MKFLKGTFFLFFIMFSSSVVFSQSNSMKDWTLAAEQFSFTQRTSSLGINDSISKTIPSLILEKIAENLTRMPRALEQLDRINYDLQKERISLFLQLSSEVQKRDSLVLGDYSERALKNKIREEEKKIQEIQKKIDENLKSFDEEKKKREKQIAIDEKRAERLEKGEIIDDEEKDDNFLKSFIRNFRQDDDLNESPLEKIALYQNNPTSLFSVSDEIKKSGYDSYEFSKACTNANIRGLLTGRITVYGSYLSVSISIYQYPGGRIIGNATDVGSTSELEELALRLSTLITPRISDSMPVELEFSISPEEAKDNLIITLDDIVYSSVPETLTISSGVHFIQFASKGFDTEATNFNFSGNRRFKVSVEMKEKSTGTLRLAFTKPVEGDLFANGEFRSKLDEENRFSSIYIGNRNVLGHFVSKDGLPSEFIIQQSLLEKDSVLQVRPAVFDKNKYIDNRRIWMYRAYSSLVISLMPTFYVLGNYNNGSTGFSFLSGEDERNFLTTARYATSAISIGCGVWFGVELVRYLIAANSTLPVEAKKMSSRTLRKIEADSEESAKRKTEENVAAQEINENDANENGELEFIDELEAEQEIKTN